MKLRLPAASRLQRFQTPPPGDAIFWFYRDDMPLSYEIEKWDDGSETAEVWVKVPQIDAATTTDFIWIFKEEKRSVEPRRGQSSLCSV